MPTDNYDVSEYCIHCTVPEFLCCRLIWGHPPPHPLAIVAILYSVHTRTGSRKIERGEPFLTGKGMKGPKSYYSTETLVLYLLYALYDLSNNLFKRKMPLNASKCILTKLTSLLVSMCYLFYVLCHRSIELSPKMRVGGLCIILYCSYIYGGISLYICYRHGCMAA
jgi:hypothetical protein